MRRTNQEEPPPGIGLFRSDADASFGGCGTRCAHTVLALFPPSRPDKGGFPFSLFACFCLFPFYFLLPFRLKGEGSVIPRMTGIPQNNPLNTTGFTLCGGNGGMCPQRQHTVKWQKKRGGNDRKGVVRLSKKGLFRSRAYRSPGGLCPPFCEVLENKNRQPADKPVDDFPPLPGKDSNPHRRNQNPKCYHYTTGQFSTAKVQIYLICCMLCEGFFLSINFC